MKQRENLLAYLALAFICVVWGTTYLALRIGVLAFPPFLFTAIRQLSAGLILLLIAFTFIKRPVLNSRYIINQAIAGFMLITLGNGLVAWAEMFIPSGIASLICSTLPAVVVLINITTQKTEKVNSSILFGIFIGLVGMVLVFGEDLNAFADNNYTIGIIFTFLATTSWAIGSFFVKRVNQGINPIYSSALQMFFGGIFLLIGSGLFDNTENLVWTSDVIYALLYLIVFGSLAAYMAYNYVISKLPLTIVSLYSYINPLVAVSLGWWVLDEKLNMRIALAFLITVVGVYFVNRGYQGKSIFKTRKLKKSVI
jgi:drug/metabolite transporter (DMT)-like permease